MHQHISENVNCLLLLNNSHILIAEILSSLNNMNNSNKSFAYIIDPRISDFCKISLKLSNPVAFIPITYVMKSNEYVVLAILFFLKFGMYVCVILSQSPTGNVYLTPLLHSRIPDNSVMSFSMRPSISLCVPLYFLFFGYFLFCSVKTYHCDNFSSQF